MSWRKALTTRMLTTCLPREHGGSVILALAVSVVFFDCWAGREALVHPLGGDIPRLTAFLGSSQTRV